MATLTKRNGESARVRPMYPRGSEFGSSLFDPFLDQIRTMRQIASAMLAGGGGQMDSGETSWFPQIQLYEKDGNYVIEALVPGFKRDEVDIDVSDNRVTISGSSERQAVEDQLKGRVHYSEFQRRDFTRTITLPAEVDPERVSARLQDGLLTITLPTVSQAQAKRIPITA
jgi:HSP20 family protein